MKKSIGLVAGILLSSPVMAIECPPPGVLPAHSECFTDNDSDVVIPYFNTRNNWSARFSIINPTDKKVTVTVRLHDVDGYVRAFNHYVLAPYDMFASGISPGKEPGTSWWFIAPNDTTCKFYDDSNTPVDEGYVTVKSEEFPTFGPGGFCGNDYEVVDVKKLRYEYTLWTEKGTLLNDYRELPSSNSEVISAWTTNAGRSTDVVVNLKSFQPGQCQEAEYLIANRQGQFFKTFDVAEPGPAGWANFQFCHKVNVVQFGTPILDTNVGIKASDQIFSLNNPGYFNNEINAGWVKWIVEGRSVSIRSEY
jgi:hypothetical protein